MTMKIKNVTFKTVGVTFDNPDGTSRQSIISGMSQASKVRLRREPMNMYDVNAIAVDLQLVGDMYVQIGYIPKQYAAILSPVMDGGTRLEATVGEVDKYKNTWYCHIIVNEVV